MLLNKKPRLPRIDRDGEIKVQEDENQHLWAVSYADFLMALLAFFILFFSMEDSSRSDLIHTLSLQFQKASLVASPEENKPRFPSSVGDIPMSASLLEKLRILNVSLAEQEKSLVIKFPENYFAPGKYKIDRENKATMTTLLEVIAPFKEHLNIYFEGHSDNEPVKSSRTAMLTDNFVLSSLRASSALHFAREHGFPEDHLYISAMGSNSRNSRTLSLRLESRVEKK